MRFVFFVVEFQTERYPRFGHFVCELAGRITGGFDPSKSKLPPVSYPTGGSVSIAPLPSPISSASRIENCPRFLRVRSVTAGSGGESSATMRSRR